VDTNTGQLKRAEHEGQRAETERDKRSRQGWKVTELREGLARLGLVYNSIGLRRRLTPFLIELPFFLFTL